MDVLRKLMTTYVNVGTTQAKAWELVGYKIEEGSIEMNPEIEKVTDILGITHTDVVKLEPQMSIEGYRVEKSNPLAEMLLDMYQTDDLAAFSQFEVLNVYGWKEVGSAPVTYTAELHTGCTLELVSIGGGTRVEMPFNIHFSNNKVLGTTNVVVGTVATPIVFTPTV